MKNIEEKKKGPSFIEKLFSGKGFYVTLAGVTLAVGVLTYFGIKASFNPQTPDIDINDPAIGVEDIILPDAGKPTPDTGTNPDEDKPTDTPVVPTLSYCLPANGVVTKDFSGEALVFSSTMGDYRVHEGIDITAEAGAEVMAAADGEITRVYSDDLMGVCVEIAHADGNVSRYANLQAVLAEQTAEGATVKGGQVIGYVGSTALLEVGDPPHLHFELLKNDIPQNPTEILPKFDK